MYDTKCDISDVLMSDIKDKERHHTPFLSTEVQ